MKKNKRTLPSFARLTGGLLLAMLTTPLTAQLAFSPPDGGWNYLYKGDAVKYAPPGEGFASLDGTWSHDNGSDAWDGSGIGGTFGADNRPGGAMIITEGDTTFLRIQDTGDPRDFGYADPSSNRKVYLGHDLTNDGAAETIMDDGVTLIFRARIPTSGPLDPLHRDGQQANGIQPYPKTGDGYVTSDGGKGNFVIKQAAGGAIAFSLTTAADTPGGNPTDRPTGFTGLSFNEFAGNAISGNVNFGQGDGANVIPFDPTVWHEFWVTIEKDAASVGTHVANFYIDGNDSPVVFKITSGPGSDFGGSYLAMGATATPQNAALDIDFFGVKFGAVAPKARTFGPINGGWNYAYEGDKATYAPPGGEFASLDGTWSHDNGSDEWDGSGIGGAFGDANRPGGAMIITEGNLNYLRIQDTGDPRDYGYADPSSNRKVYLGHDLSANGATETVMDDGVTLNFRARIPTSGSLDSLHRDGQQANGVQPYPAGGDGYVTSDGGKGNFVIKQAAGGAIAFSLTTAADTPGGNPTDRPTGFNGLSFNEFAGNAISGNVNFGQGDGANIIPFDPTQWHDIWITIEKDSANVGTHVASIYVDGNLTPNVFKVTSGPGSDFGGSYIAMGSTATPQNSALDIDYYRVKFGVVPPTGAIREKLDILDLLPVIAASNVSPSAGVTFRATTDGSIPKENIKVVLNGIDYSSALEVTGSEKNWSVALKTLQENRVYTGEVLVRGSGGGTLSGLLAFNTFSNNNPTFEAENWNFDRGQFINNPGLPFSANGYFDKGTGVNTEGIDFHELSAEFDINTPNPLRYPLSGNMPNTVPNTNEAGRAKYANNPDDDFSVNNTQVGEWLNYTGNFTTGDANIYLRASGGSFEVQLDRVTSSASQANQTTQKLGTFKSQSGGGYVWVPLTNDAGALQALPLSGETTLRATILSGSPVLNFFMVTPAVEVVIPGPTETTLVAKLAGTQLTLSWEGGGSLQSTAELGGNWSAVSNASSPYTTQASGSQRFFRVR
ncbi:MAG: hypothetical protein O2960_05880 [Verrucomicrobia bacterium]|nr:hypothetical protein [Verrucomicrobiota bacterium]